MLLASTQSPLKDVHIAILHFNILMNFFYVSKNNNKINEITARAAVAVVVGVIIVVMIIVKCNIKVTFRQYMVHPSFSALVVLLLFIFIVLGKYWVMIADILIEGYQCCV
jgi:cell division protein FtsW (lipid II flippase)